MFRRILVAADGRASFSRALVAALQLARVSRGRLQLMHAVADEERASGNAYGVDLTQLFRDRADNMLRDAVAVARAAGIPCDQQPVDAPGRPPEDILSDAACSWEADVVVIGSHGVAGAVGAVTRNMTEELLRSSVAASVLVVREADAALPGATLTPAPRHAT